MVDPYQILGVTKTATAGEIRKAYLRLAKQNHPDLHPGDKGAEDRFKAIASAYDIIGDETKRAQFDRGEIDASGAEQHPAGRGTYRRHAEGQPGFKYERYWNADGEGDDVFAELFRRHAAARARGEDVRYTFTIAFIEAIEGVKKRVVMADGKTLDITIPAGLKDGQTLRLRGQGRPGTPPGEPGDVLVEVHVQPHPIFRREGDDIHSTLPITLGEALGGARLEAETVSGKVALTIPKGARTGMKLRLRGKGVPLKSGAVDAAGDHFVELNVVLPEKPDDDLVRAVVDWEAKHPYDPRKPVGAAA